MDEQTHAPGWRGRPRIYGPLQSDLDRAEKLERIATMGCALMAAATLAFAAAAWASDAIAGHL